jgi:hypothetical protein
MRQRAYVVEIETALGVFKKGVIATSEKAAVEAVQHLQRNTNKHEIAYCPAGPITKVYPRPAGKPLPPTVPASIAQYF